VLLGYGARVILKFLVIVRRGDDGELVKRRLEFPRLGNLRVDVFGFQGPRRPLAPALALNAGIAIPLRPAIDIHPVLTLPLAPIARCVAVLPFLPEEGRLTYSQTRPNP
jgi:hypothetical protein